MTLFTSYYYKYGYDPRAVSISRGRPDWYTGKVAIKLAPSWDLIKRYKSKYASEAEYTAEYTSYLDSLGEQTVLSMLNEGDILLCYESPKDFCHRHILADWLRRKGHSVQEI